LKEIGVSDLNEVEFNKLLLDHLYPYVKFLGRKELNHHFVAIVKGKLSDLERKTMEPIAVAYEGNGEIRNLANFFSRSSFDHEGMLNEYKKEIGELLSHPNGMITGDGCDFPKKGKNSVGVAHQYCGSLGKVSNCQASVMMGYCSPEGYGLSDFSLYMPKSWFSSEFESLRDKCGVPKNLEFSTKNQMLLEMIKSAVNSGHFKGKYVGVDCSFGDDNDFLDSLPDNLTYFADVASKRLVFPSRPKIMKSEKSRQSEKTIIQPISVKTIGDDPSIPWQDVVLGIGSKGPIIGKDKCIKVVESRNNMPGKDVWLYVRKLEDGKIKYSLCNESMDATPEMIRTPALMRWSIEQCFNECKDYLGMDHYELRSWKGWRKHILFTLITHLFIIKLRRLFSFKTNSPGPTLYLSAPVPLSEFRDAISMVDKNLPIDNPNISVCPDKPQQILTIGMISTLVLQFLPRMTQAIEKLDHMLQSMADSFWSHATAKLEIIQAYPDPPGIDATGGKTKSKKLKSSL
jgi:SRSO17 transposase